MFCFKQLLKWKDLVVYYFCPTSLKTFASGFENYVSFKVCSDCVLDIFKRFFFCHPL